MCRDFGIGRENRLGEELVEGVVDFGVDDSLGIRMTVVEEDASCKCRSDEHPVLFLSGDDRDQDILFVFVGNLFGASNQEFERGQDCREERFHIGIIRLSPAHGRDDSQLV